MSPTTVHSTDAVDPAGTTDTGTTNPAGTTDPAGATDAAQAGRAPQAGERVRTARVRTRRRNAVVDVPVPTLLVGLALLPLVPVYGPAAALPAVVGGAVLGAVVALVSARAGWSGATTALVAVGVYLLAGGPLAAPATTTWGVVPTGETFRSLLAGVVTVWREVLTLEPPLGSGAALLVAPFLLGLAGSAVAVSVALRTDRAAPWAALVAVPVLAVALLLGTAEPVWPLAAGAAAAVIGLVWVARRRGVLATRRLPALVLVGAVSVYGATVAGPQLAADNPRLVLRDEIVPPFDPRDHPSPLSSFRRYVRDLADTELLTVRNLPEGAAVRLATMDAYDGVVWNVAGASGAEGSGRFRRVGETTGVTARGTRHEVEIEVHDLPTVWLPTVGWTDRVTFGDGAQRLGSELRYNDATGTAVVTGGVPAGARWTAEVVVPPADDDDALDRAAAAEVPLPEPQGVPDAVPVFAGRIAGTATSPALIARTLEQGLAERGWFSHGLVEQGQPLSLSGHGADRMTTLLTGDLMVGDAEQYASAMALMAREMGLPARVVMGFVPESAEEEVTVTGSDVHAWVEVAFSGHGWVAFDPTPDESRTPTEEMPVEESDPQPQVVQPPPPPPDPVQPPPEDPEQARTEDTGEQRPDARAWQQVAVVVVSVALPLLLLLGPLLLVALAKRRRRRRRRAAARTVDQVVGGWDEVLDVARDLRRPPPVGATRREIAVGLAAAFTVPTREGAPRPGDPQEQHRQRRPRTDRSVSGPVAGLAAGADAVVFGPGEPLAADVDAYWQQVDTAVAAMRRVVPRRRRWWSRWSTASLRAGRAERAGRAGGAGRAGRAERRRAGRARV